MKKAFSFVLLLAIAVGLVFGINVNSTASAATRKLYIYNWGGYIDSALEEEFEQYYFEQTGERLDIVYTTFETNEEMLTKVMKEKADLDLICPSEYAIERLLRNDMLLKLDKSKLPNIANIDQRIYDKVDNIFDDIVINSTNAMLSDYFVPYMWGTLGILYNADVVKQQDIDSGWGILWNKGDNPKLDRKILMKDSIRDSYVAALMYLKENDMLPAPYKTKTVQQLINTVDNTLLKLVEEVLVEQIPFVKGYEVDYGKDDMVKGKAYVNLAWSGDALWAIEEWDVNLNYFVPKSGGNIWFDGWVIPKNAPNADIAYMFLDYLCRPEIAIRNSMEIGYTNALDVSVLRNNVEVQAILLENEYDIDEYFDNELRYPDINDPSLGVMKDFGEMNDEVVAMWERVKIKGSRVWILIVVIVGAVLIAGAIVAFLLLKNNKGKRRVKRS